MKKSLHIETASFAISRDDKLWSVAIPFDEADGLFYDARSFLTCELPQLNSLAPIIRLGPPDQPLTIVADFVTPDSPKFQFFSQLGLALESTGQILYLEGIQDTSVITAYVSLPSARSSVELMAKEIKIVLLDGEAHRAYSHLEAGHPREGAALALKFLKNPVGFFIEVKKKYRTTVELRTKDGLSVVENRFPADQRVTFRLDGATKALQIENLVHLHVVIFQANTPDVCYCLHFNGSYQIIEDDSNNSEIQILVDMGMLKRYATCPE